MEVGMHREKADRMDEIVDHVHRRSFGRRGVSTRHTFFLFLLYLNENLFAWKPKLQGWTKKNIIPWNVFYFNRNTPAHEPWCFERLTQIYHWSRQACCYRCSRLRYDIWLTLRTWLSDWIDWLSTDHVGGHIKASNWVPSSTLDVRLPELLRTLKDKEMVVFHCALSQQRGPSAALRYARERERTLSPEEYQKQEVYVLEGGFVQWQEKYGKDEQLTEAYAEDIWQEY